jgi:hypothetical protein
MRYLEKYKPLLICFSALIISFCLSFALSPVSVTYSAAGANLDEISQNYALANKANSKDLDEKAILEDLQYIGRVGGSSWAVAINGAHAFIGEGYGLTILDITEASSPVVVGKTAPVPSTVRDVTVAESYAYVVVDQGLCIFDVTDVKAPVEVGFLDIPGAGVSVAVVDNIAYLASDRALHIINVADPMSLEESARFDFEGKANQMVAIGDYVYLALSSGLQIINISDPSSPSAAGDYEFGRAYSVAVSGDYAYIGAYSGLRIVDVSDPNNPSETYFFEEDLFLPGDIDLKDNNAYIADTYGSLRIFNISDPKTPVQTGSYDPPTDVAAIALQGNYAYLAAGQQGGLNIVDVSSSTQPSQKSFYRSFYNADVVAIAGNTAFTTSRYQQPSALFMIDVSNPRLPVVIGAIDTDPSPEGVAISGEYAFLGGGGLNVVNISNPFEPIETGFVDFDFYYPTVALQEDYAFAVGDGLFIVNINEPSNPTVTSFFLTDGFAMDVAVAEQYAYVAQYADGLQIVDVSNKSMPIEAGEYNLGRANGVSIDGRFCYIAGSGGLRIIDVLDPQTPVEVGNYLPLEGSGHDVALQDQYVYYIEQGTIPGNVGRRYNGLRILDASDPTEPSEVGFYETTGDAKGIAVSGEYVYIADGEAGLVILRLPGSDNGVYQAYLPTVLTQN